MKPAHVTPTVKPMTPRHCQSLGRALALAATLIALASSTPHAAGAAPKMLPVLTKSGQAYVNALELACNYGIAVKELPGQNLVAACHKERCVTLKEFRREGEDTLVMIGPLAKALDLKAAFNDDRSQVSFSFETRTATTRLDGTSIALSDLRGRRVVINSWASW
jgi:hypothetical protein